VGPSAGLNAVVKNIPAFQRYGDVWHWTACLSTPETGLFDVSSVCQGFVMHK